MIDDPIVEEVRATRASIFDECGGDFGRLFERYKVAQAQYRGRLVTLQQVDVKRRLRERRSQAEPS